MALTIGFLNLIVAEEAMVGAFFLAAFVNFLCCILAVVCALQPDVEDGPAAPRPSGRGYASAPHSSRRASLSGPWSASVRGPTAGKTLRVGMYCVFLGGKRAKQASTD